MSKLSDAAVDAMVREQYEDALANGEEWAEHAYEHFQELLSHLNTRHIEGMTDNAKVTRREWIDVHSFLHEIDPTPDHDYADLSPGEVKP